MSHRETIPVSEELYNQLVNYSENYEILILKARDLVKVWNDPYYGHMCIEFIEEIARLPL